MPIRVDFYLLESSAIDARWLVACRLLEKAYKLGHRVYVHCDHQQDAELLDELLWTFKDDSFIPHNLLGEGPYSPPPIQLGHSQAPKGFNDILLNLAHDIPVFYTQFKRIMELVSNVESEKEQSRVRFKAYRAKGCQIHTHPLG
ncbi:MAG: DNA polymerase III subunit chi [Legionella sp.]|nr:DNA polymerase III subunit chi [Legionella sp.]